MATNRFTGIRQVESLPTDFSQVSSNIIYVLPDKTEWIYNTQHSTWDSVGTGSDTSSITQLQNDVKSLHAQDAVYSPDLGTLEPALTGIKVGRRNAGDIYSYWLEGSSTNGGTLSTTDLTSVVETVFPEIKNYEGNTPITGLFTQEDTSGDLSGVCHLQIKENTMKLNLGTTSLTLASGDQLTGNLVGVL